MKTFIIAEAGVNHNGDIAIAKRMIDIAKDSGADAVKFQTYRTGQLVCLEAPKAEYQERVTDQAESQYEMLKRLEFGDDVYPELKGYCDKVGIQFISTPFDLESIDVVNGLGVDVFKVPSGEITNLPYLRKIGALKKRIILSTGMADLAEVGEALSILVDSGARKEDITILHCNTEYPTPDEDANLRAMLTINRELDVKVGYSDHTVGIDVSIAAVAMGAMVIEKHFTLDRNMSGPDHKASIEPDGLKALVRAIRRVELAMGHGEKRTSPSEMKNMPIARKSIVAMKSIKKGEVLTSDNLTVKRPGTGISPMEWDSVIGSTADRDYEEDELIGL